MTSNEKQRLAFLKHNRQHIPAPVYNDKYPLQVMVVIEDGQPHPYSGVCMTNDEIDSIRQVWSAFQAQGGASYFKLWTATRSADNPAWKVNDWSNIILFP